MRRIAQKATGVQPWTWDEYERKARRSSERWASTDRGWLFARAWPTMAPYYIDYAEERVTLGHYLDYGPDHYRSEASLATEGMGSVHCCSCVTRRSQYVMTPEDARAWIEREALAVFGAIPDGRVMVRPGVSLLVLS